MLISRDIFVLTVKVPEFKEVTFVVDSGHLGICSRQMSVETSSGRGSRAFWEPQLACPWALAHSIGLSGPR